MHNSKQIIKIKIQHITQLKIEHTLLCTQILNREHPTTITWHPSDKQEHNHLKHSSQWYEPSLSQQKIPNSEHPIEHAIHSRSRQARKAAASNKKQKFNQQQRIEQQIFSNRKKSTQEGAPTSEGDGRGREQGGEKDRWCTFFVYALSMILAFILGSLREGFTCFQTGSGQTRTGKPISSELIQDRQSCELKRKFTIASDPP